MKKFLLFVLSFLVLFSFGITAEAKGNAKKAETELVFADEIIVDEDGGKFEVGFATIKFKNGWLEDDLPITFEIELYAENGEVFIEITPDVDYFLKDVVISTKGYSGYIFDVATGENIYVEIPKQKFEAEHFSRYCWGI